MQTPAELLGVFDSERLLQDYRDRMFASAFLRFLYHHFA